MMVYHFFLPFRHEVDALVLRTISTAPLIKQAFLSPSPSELILDSPYLILSAIILAIIFTSYPGHLT